MEKAITFIGAAAGKGGYDPRSCDAANAFKSSSYFHQLKEHHIQYHWQTIIEEIDHTDDMKVVTQFCQSLAKETQQAVKQKHRFCTIGGDHSFAIGTWSGVASALTGDLGLIWIDAHMDAHTTESTATGNIHGMPVAALLGYGDQRLTDIEFSGEKIKPENICLVGIRSFEPEEKSLLDQLGVTVFDSKKIATLGIHEVIQRCYQQITANTQGFGLSIDLDGIDPKDAPGTGTPVPEGIDGNELCQALAHLANDPRLLGFDIAEFNHYLDINHKTEQLMIQLILALTGGITSCTQPSTPKTATALRTTTHCP